MTAGAKSSDLYYFIFKSYVCQLRQYNGTIHGQRSNFGYDHSRFTRNGRQRVPSGSRSLLISNISMESSSCPLLPPSANYTHAPPLNSCISEWEQSSCRTSLLLLLCNFIFTRFFRVVPGFMAQFGIHGTFFFCFAYSTMPVTTQLNDFQGTGTRSCYALL